ncbi:sensor histidine kinase KdpD [Paraglaciecola sp. L3A3]|uniref:sensor histidine kinase n=1 Tax=Paraglaciecola sp. L3A3 TaxID=2686358 RepID=UPI00131BF852|nr:HAMP domain-containing sensor histidine kinase [Paraglaciecola sp. L3A3]
MTECLYLINHNQSKLTLLIYVIIGVIAVSIASLFVVEAQQNKRQLNSHKQLLHDTVRKTLVAQLASSLEQYPQSMEEVEKHWQTIATEVFLYQQGKQIYPYAFLGNNTLKMSPKWQQFTTMSAELSEAELKRSSVLNRLQLAIHNKASSDINALTQEYFNLVANYQLSPLSEVVSALTFLTIDQQEQWNPELIKQVLMTGNSLFKPVSYYIFKENSGFSQADLQHMQTTIKRLLETANISTKWFIKNSELMTLAPPEFNQHSAAIENFTLLSKENKQFIYVELNQQYNLIMPYNIIEALAETVKELRKQGVLSYEDSIQLQPNSALTTLHHLLLVIDKPEWKMWSSQQQLFLISKFTLLLISVISLIFVTRLLINQQKKKQDYLAMREQFISLVSHELKTPLAAIRVMAETVDKRHKRLLSLKDYPNRIVNEVDRLWLMVDNLLSMNRLKSNEINLNYQRINLHVMVNYCLEKSSEYCDLPLEPINNIGKSITVNADELLFELVISNLISNAIKYNDKSIIRIEFSYDKTKNELTIIDNACGIDSTQWLSVFDEFTRLPQQKSVSGNGIGLSLCKLILQQHNAEIEIHHSTSQGTTWKIIF